MRVKNMNILFAMTVFGLWQVASASNPRNNYDDYFQQTSGLSGPEYQISKAQLQKLYQQDPYGLADYVKGKNIILCENSMETESGDMYREEYGFLDGIFYDDCTEHSTLSGISLFEYFENINNNGPNYAKPY